MDFGCFSGCHTVHIPAFTDLQLFDLNCRTRTRFPSKHNCKLQRRSIVLHLGGVMLTARSILKATNTTHYYIRVYWNSLSTTWRHQSNYLLTTVSSHRHVLCFTDNYCLHDLMSSQQSERWANNHLAATCSMQITPTSSSPPLISGHTPLNTPSNWYIVIFFRNEIELTKNSEYPNTIFVPNNTD